MSSNDKSESLSDDYTDISDTESCTDQCTMGMQDILVEMVMKRKLLCEHEMLLTFYAKDVDDQYDNNNAVEKFETISAELKVFAIFLHFYSPETYKYIRENYNTPLPNSKVLSKLYENCNYQPGFTKQGFDILARRQASTGGRLVCSLIADTMQLFIRQSYVPIDVGAGPLDNDNDNESREVFVILLVSLKENWKIPVGFFIADYISSQIKAELIKMCLHRSYEAGVDVVSITQPTALGEMLGCKLRDYKNLKTTFKHPACDRQVAVFIDPTLSLRSIRNKFEGNKEIYDGKKRKMNWKLIDTLRKMPTKERFPFHSKPLTDILMLRNFLVKIDFISELFTLSLAEALELCKNRLKLPDFKDAEQLIEFITILNTLYDILHSKTGQAGFKQPMCRDNAREITEFLEKAKNYISSIYYFNKIDVGRRNISSKQLGVKDKEVAGFRWFLISIESLKHVYCNLVEGEQRLDAIATQLLGWDHIDDFFENFRRRNPKQHGGRFQQMYQDLFRNIESEPAFIDRVPIQSYPISDLDKALDVINRSCGKRYFDSYCYVGPKRCKTQDDSRANSYVHTFLTTLHAEQDISCRKQMVGYIAGWIAVQLAKALRCEECIDALYSDKKLCFHKFITLKELSGVCLPSEQLFRVCWECERAVRSGGGARLWAANDAVLRRLISRTSQVSHTRTSHPFHHLHLTRAIVAKYTRLRLGKDDPRQQTDRRQLLFLFNFD